MAAPCLSGFSEPRGPRAAVQQLHPPDRAHRVGGRLRAALRRHRAEQGSREDPWQAPPSSGDRTRTPRSCGRRGRGAGCVARPGRGPCRGPGGSRSAARRSARPSPRRGRCPPAAAPSGPRGGGCGRRSCAARHCPGLHAARIAGSERGFQAAPRARPRSSVSSFDVTTAAKCSRRMSVAQRCCWWARAKKARIRCDWRLRPTAPPESAGLAAVGTGRVRGLPFVRTALHLRQGSLPVSRPIRRRSRFVGLPAP